MKLSYDKEMDEALRRHARRADGSALPAQDGAHMDADEISAYAENALPAATRLRYAAHLADCDHCRRLVISGTLAANVAGALEQQATANSTPAHASSASWRGWLAALFSARALRYAAPALALVLVGTVAFIVLRQKQAPESAGLVTEQRRGDAQMPPGNAPAANGSMNSAVTSPATTETSELDARESSAQTSANSATGGRAATNAQPTDELMARRAEESGVGASSQTIPQAAPAPAVTHEASPRAGATPHPNTGLTMSAPAEAANSNAAVARERSRQPAGVREGELVAQSRDDARRNAPPAPPPSATAPSGAVAGAGVAADSAAGPEERATQSRRRAAARVASPRAQAQREEDQTRSETAETRRAGGRTFRRQGNAWVDTAYRSSLSTISMSRNSEQYRALVADEPALGRIVQQLGGEVLIVWRGRAYRIR